MTQATDEDVWPDTQPMDIIREYGGAPLGDARLEKRLVKLAPLLAEKPSASLPGALGEGAELEACYRLLNNDKATPQLMATPHFEETVARAAQRGLAIVAHDTTSFGFAGSRKGLGPLLRQSGKKGFYAHASLCIGADAEHEPLGLVAIHCWTRKGSKKGKRSHKARQQDRTNESLRWPRQIEAAEKRLKAKDVRVVHVMDRESDSYEIFAKLQAKDRHFVCRATYNRVLSEVEGGTSKLFDALESAPAMLSRSVPLAPRKDNNRSASQRKIHPSRRQRIAQLEIGAVSLTLRRPGPAPKKLPEQLPMNVVIVRETGTPPGEVPVEWILFTNEPIGTPEEVAAVVDTYRARWLIEEYFKALKTGCEYQKLQLESYDALLRALVLYLPIAWHLLALRHLARTQSDEPATRVLTETQVDALRAVVSTVPAQPTVREAMLGIAALGGHLKRNGEPGWLVIGRGLRELLQIEVGWRAAHQALRERYDQS